MYAIKRNLIFINTSNHDVQIRTCVPCMDIEKPKRGAPPSRIKHSVLLLFLILFYCVTHQSMYDEFSFFQFKVFFFSFFVVQLAAKHIG